MLKRSTCSRTCCCASAVSMRRSQLLKGWQGPADWMAYARFNLGVALVRAGRLAEADPVLTAVGTLDSDKEELLALKDRANLALGFAYLQADKPQQALPHPGTRAPAGSIFQQGAARHRLGGCGARGLPARTDARGLSCAIAICWMRRSRNPIWPCLMPLASLRRMRQAAQYYESALESFDAEDGRLDLAISRFANGHMLDTILDKEQGKHYGWFWQLESLPGCAGVALSVCGARRQRFPGGAEELSRSRLPRPHARALAGSMDAFGAMIDTRERAYAERLPRADALLATDAADELQRRREALAGRLNSVEAGRCRSARLAGGARAVGAGPAHRGGVLPTRRRVRTPTSTANGCGWSRACSSVRLDEAFKARVLAAAPRDQGPRSALAKRRTAGCACSVRARACPPTPANLPRALRRCRCASSRCRWRLVSTPAAAERLSRRTLPCAAAGTERSPGGLPGAGALCARGDLRPRQRPGQCGKPRQRHSPSRRRRAAA